MILEKKIKLLIRLLGPIILLVIFYFYVDIIALKRILFEVRWSFFTFSVIISPLLVFIRSLRWKNILEKFDITYPIFSCYRVYFVEFVTIAIIPTIGTFIKAIYLKRDGFGYLKPILSIIADKYFDYILPITLGITSLFLVTLKLQPKVSLIILLLMVCVLFIPSKHLVSIFPFQVIPKRLKSIINYKDQNIENHFVSIQKALELNSYILAIIAFFIYYFAIFLLCLGLNLRLSFAEVVLIDSATTVLTVIPISFLGIGTRDVGLLAAFRLFGHAPEEAIALSMALLLLRLAILLMGSIFWLTDPPPLYELKRMR